MVKSMTGFGRGEYSDSNRTFVVEMKSVNFRYNDIVVKIPRHLSMLEENIKKLVKDKVKRGRVEIFINFNYIQESGIDVKVDLLLAQNYKKSIEKIAEELGLDSKIGLDMIIGLPDVLTTENKEEDIDEIWNCLKVPLEEALDKMMAMRIKEGNELAKDIIKRTEKIKELLIEIENRAPNVVMEYKEKLWMRINELLENKYELDENRLINEVAYFADKSNINEEIVRLFSHIKQLVKTLECEEPIGRKLDFLVQEMNREVNTIGSKVSDIEITNNVVQLKSELEKIREQVQNIE